MAAAAHARPEDPSECGPDYWRALCPWLHVDDKTYQDIFLASASPSATAEGEDYSAHKQRLVEEGYTTMMTSDDDYNSESEHNGEDDDDLWLHNGR